MEHPLLADITQRLRSLSDTPALDASVLIGHILHQSRTWVIAHPEVTLTVEQQRQMDDSLRRLARGESFPYVLGHWEFFGLEFEVTHDVLIPRPETELLVEKAIAWLQKFPARRRVADVGTGSGAIAVAIAVNVRDADILATDISLKALEIAKRNAEKHGVNQQIEFLECDLLPPISLFPNRQSSIDLLCANLPYVPTDTLSSLAVFRREPSLALDGGPDGLDVYRKLFSIVPGWMAPGGKMLLEIEATQGAKILAEAEHAFEHAELRLHRDLSGHDRLLEVTIS